jgi:hypothetical protein
MAYLREALDKDAAVSENDQRQVNRLLAVIGSATKFVMAAG